MRNLIGRDELHDAAAALNNAGRQIQLSIQENRVLLIFNDEDVMYLERARGRIRNKVRFLKSELDYLVKKANTETDLFEIVGVLELLDEELIEKGCIALRCERAHPSVKKTIFTIYPKNNENNKAIIRTGTEADRDNR